MQKITSEMSPICQTAFTADQFADLCVRVCNKYGF